MELPAEIWNKIFQYHHRTVREIARKKKQKLHDELLKITFSLYTDPDENKTVQKWGKVGRDYLWPRFCYDIPFTNAYIQRIYSPIYKTNNRFYIKAWRNFIVIDITCADVYNIFGK